MKECKYCGSQCGDQVVKCPSCGGTKFFTAQEQIEEEHRQQKERENEERAVAEPDTGKKRIGAIIGGLLAAILIIVTVIIVLSNRPLSNGISKSECDEILESGIAYYESGNYESAIECFLQLPSDSKQYAKASDILTSARAEYKESALSKVDNYIQQENYDSAFSVIETAAGLVGNDPDLNAAYEEAYSGLVSSMLATADSYVENSDYEIALEYLSNCQNRFPDDLDLENAYNDTFSEYCSVVKNEALSTADEAMANEDYETAITSLSNGLNVIGHDEELSALLASYQSDYITQVINAAKDIYTEYAAESIFASEAIIETALDLIPNDERLLSERNYYQNLEPVNLFDLSSVDTGGSFSKVDSASDASGIEYSNVYRVERFAFDAYDWHYPGIEKWRWYAYKTIDIDYQYSRVTGTIFQSEKYQTASTETVLEVNSNSDGDDGWLNNDADWGGIVSGNAGPVSFSVDISGEKYLTILFLGDHTAGSEDEAYNYALLSDIYLWR